MRPRIRYPLDPECPAVQSFHERADDPQMIDSGCWPEFLEDFERTHGRACERCRSHGLDNVEVAEAT